MIIKTLEEAIEVVKDVRSEMADARDGIAVQAIDMVLEAVKEPRPHGEWLTQWKDTCSQCKKEFDVPTGDNCKALWNYCPNCGASMRKEGGAG